MLTGRQVSQGMKVFIVSQAGKVADVTLQSSCHSEDESVLKVKFIVNAQYCCTKNKSTRFFFFFRFDDSNKSKRGTINHASQQTNVINQSFFFFF